MLFDRYPKLDISARALFQEYYMEDWSAESGFTSFFMWNEVLDCRYAVIHDIFCIFLHTEEGPCVSLFSKNFTLENVRKAIAELKVLLEGDGFALTLAYVPPRLLELIELLDEYNYEVCYNRKDSDYIYETKSLTDFDGKEHRSKRYDLNYFQKKFEPIIEPMHKDNAEQCLDFMEKMVCSQKDCCNCEYGCERDALRTVLPYFDALGLCGIFVMTQGEIAAYVIGERMSERLFAYHFLKLDRSRRGVSVFLQKEFAELFHAEIPYINYSEDLACSGLKQYKLKMHPHRLVHKYFVTITSLLDGE